MRILLTGRAGQVGSALQPLLAPLGELTALGRPELDLADPGRIGALVEQGRPEVIVNAAAVGVLAAQAKRLDALLAHFYTDYVFDGEKPSPYLESDPARPLNVYGESKLAGERAVAASGCRHFVFRTSWVYSGAGRNFLLAILAAAATRPELRVVDDQDGAPTSSAAIARAVAQILARRELRERPSGTYHLSAAGATTWHGFAKEILAARSPAVPLRPIDSAEYPTAARRPRNSLLDNARLRETFGVALPDWRDGLASVLRAMR